MTEWDVPLELKSELFVFSVRRFVLCANEDVVEEEEVSQLPLAFGQFDDERVFDQMSLRTFQMGKHAVGVLNIVLVDEVLRRLERLVQCRKVLTVIGSVFDQVLK